jgi:hypothetical protein
VVKLYEKELPVVPILRLAIAYANRKAETRACRGLHVSGTDTPAAANLFWWCDLPKILHLAKAWRGLPLLPTKGAMKTIHCTFWPGPQSEVVTIRVLSKPKPTKFNEHSPSIRLTAMRQLRPRRVV